MIASIMQGVSDIGKSWYLTLLGFKPSELKTIFLLAINTVVQLYSQPIFWGIIAGCLATMIIAETYMLCFLLIPSVIITLFMVPLVLIIRPSADKKDWRYLFASSKTLLGVIAGGVLIGLDYISDLAAYHWPIVDYTVSLIKFNSIVWALAPLGILWLAWVFDARAHVIEYVKTVPRAGKMFIYHLPFFAVIGILFFLFDSIPFARLLDSVHNASMLFLAIMFLLVIMIVIAPLYCALIVQGYIRFLRQEFKRYYEV